MSHCYENLVTNSLSALTLANLPEDILHHILDYLLPARHVLTRDPDTLARSYHFEVATLRICKAIATQAADIFHSNHFVLVSTNDLRILDDDKNYDLRLWRQKIPKFKKYTMRLHIVAQTIETTTSHFFLLCASDLDNFVMRLRTIYFTAEPQYKVMIEVKGLDKSQGMLSNKQQRALLLPFTKLRGAGQKCNIKGMVVPDLVKRVTDMVASPIHWIRAQARDVFEILVYKAAIADSLFLEEHFAAASFLYAEADVFTSNSILRMQAAMQGLADRGIYGAMSHFAIAQAINGDRAHLWRFYKEPPDNEEHQTALLKTITDASPVEGTTPEQRATILHVKGLAELLLGEVTIAHGFFQESLELHYNEQVKTCLTAVRRLARQQRTNQYFLDIMCRLMSTTPNTPWPHSDDIKVSTIAAFDQEVFDLRQLGYPGPFLDGCLKQKAGYSVENGYEVDKMFDEKQRLHELKPLQRMLTQDRVSGGCRSSKIDVVIGAVCYREHQRPEEKEVFLQAAMQRGFAVFHRLHAQSPLHLRQVLAEGRKVDGVIND